MKIKNINNGTNILVNINKNETIKYKIKKVLKEKTTDKFKYEVIENDKLAFDHALVITSGILRLKKDRVYRYCI